MRKWTIDNMPSQDGLAAVVTGTGGLGLEVAQALARAGAEVVLAPVAGSAPDEADTAGGAVPVPEATAPRSVGHVTSVALHHELGPVALALVKRGTDESAPLAVVVDGLVIAAAQEIVVPASAGAAAGVPRLPRLGAVRR